MIDIIKEFNMTDLLGMLVPGSVVAFLIDKEYNVLTSLSMLTEADFSAGLEIALVIVAGYFIGMLLHEIGDCVEKMLWYFPAFNPRVYAAYATGAYDYLNKNIQHQMIKNVIFQSGKHYVVGMGIWGLLFYLMLRIIAVDSISLWGCVFAGLIVAVVFSVISYIWCWWRKSQGTEKLKNLFSISSVKGYIRDVEIICTENEPLSFSVWKVAGDSDEYIRMVLRKRDLFDGFRTAARNLLISFMLIGLHACLTSDLTHYLRALLLRSSEVIWIICITVCLLILRYYHFSYLRYKYCYEDFVLQKKKQLKEQGTI